jgi:hypothetical protein
LDRPGAIGFNREKGQGGMEYLGLLAAKMAEPISIVLAIVGALVSREWWHAAIAALAVAIAGEALLFWAQGGARVFNPVIFTIGLAAAAIWVGLFFAVKSWFGRERAG